MDFSAVGEGMHCAKSCSTTTDCPAGFTCYNYYGADLCISKAHFGTATFSGAAGASCSVGADCHSDFCPSASCVSTCANSADCGGQTCVWNQVDVGSYVAACGPALGTGHGGDSCTQDSDCQSGVCVGGTTCADLCSSSNQCSASESCVIADYSNCPAFGSCTPDLVRVCYAGSSAPGSDPIGAPCTSYTTCRGGICDTTLNICTDTCGGDADCPANYRCKALVAGQLSDGTTNVWLNVCLPSSA
jgi:hypothetical protein